MYNKFSDLYDILTFDIDYRLYSKNIVKILADRKILKGNMLEIGCGTGNLTKELSKQDFDILAFDLSNEMLDHANKKLSGKENVFIFQADMFSFNFEAYEFDAIVSLLDVINYITEEEDLEYIFMKIHKALKDGGVFIFDINSENKLKKVLGNNSYIYEYENIFYSWENELVDDDLVYFNLTFFVKNKDGKYSRIDEEQVERYYSVEYILKALKKAGFSDIIYIDEDTGKYVTNDSQRILFAANK